MARHLFIAQATLSNWMEQDKVSFSENRMTIKADGRTFTLVEAVRFVAVEGGGADKTGLLGKVKTMEQLRAMGAERCADSVLLQDAAYKVQEGFVGEILLSGTSAADPIVLTAKRAGPKAAPETAPRPLPQARTAPVQPAATPPPLPKPAGVLASAPPGPGAGSKPDVESRKNGEAKKEGEPTDEELLTQFLLKNL
jgi:hypothetical protein